MRNGRFRLRERLRLRLRIRLRLRLGGGEIRGDRNYKLRDCCPYPWSEHYSVLRCCGLAVLQSERGKTFEVGGEISNVKVQNPNDK